MRNQWRFSTFGFIVAELNKQGVDLIKNDYKTLSRFNVQCRYIHEYRDIVVHRNGCT